ncbi:extracellular solute-binding protein [Aliiruegeria lutimaris]|uniref:Putrescine-binding periplasmic protein n=1 Tax=Aliiruegeria lutimaris TaxID=571298 RepID=A0A1G8S439_9RHOB|nr:extracellular solute-binding protein [Aliiruegeria lutimaris]SDJ23967.1 putrescine transport system substrate-binding protein [Aliiruegeria lutimaris]
MHHRTRITWIFAALLAGNGAGAAAQELAIYNWADYFGESTISNYEAETGAEVTLDFYESNEVLETKLLTGGSGFDVVFPAASNAEREFAAGALHPVDPSRLENYGNLDPEIVSALDQLPGGRQLGVPYTWGTVGLAYNSAMIAERLGDVSVDSWDIVFKPELAARIADCGIAVLDSPIELVSIGLDYLGHDPYSNDRDQLDEVTGLLTGLAGNTRYFANQRAVNDLATGDICMAILYSGDAGIAQARAMEAESGPEILYAIPKEGTLLWIDLMAIPADSGNIDAAYRFIDYMLRPDVIAEVTDTVYFANANAAADGLVDPAIRSDPGIYPDAATREGLFADRNVDAKTLRARTRLWTKVKSGV